MATKRDDDDPMHPTVRRILGAWQLLAALAAVAAAALHMEWRVADHEQRIKALEDDNKPLAAELATIKQQGTDILARLDRIERRQDEENGYPPPVSSHPSR